MRTKNILKHLILGVLMLTTGKVIGQVSTGTNVAAFGTDFLGWDNTFPANNFPLMVRHDLNQPIDFYTDSIQRMRLWETSTNTINGFGPIEQNGFLGLSARTGFFTGGVGPFSRLHLV